MKTVLEKSGNGMHYCNVNTSVANRLVKTKEKR